MKSLILALGSCFLLSIGSQTGYADNSSGAAGTASSSEDMSCKNPAGKMQQACNSIKEALEDPCNKEFVDQLRQKAQSGQMEDAQEFCPNQSSVASSGPTWDSVLLDFFAGIVNKESGGNAEAANSGAPNGTAKGLFQIDAKSTGHYKCCKGFNGSNENDPKANATCGVGLNLENMDKGSCWAHGHGGDANSFGAAKFQQVCRDGTSKDAETKKQIAENTKKACENPSASGLGSGGGGGTTF